jgi:hypothetical protein
MRRVWYEVDPVLYSDMKQQVASVYPSLHFSSQGKTIFLTGSFPLLLENKVIDRYSIAIGFPAHYPGDLPFVREIGGRIPKTADRHVYSNGIACLFLPDERAWIWPEGSGLLEYLSGPVHNYFLSQSVFETDGVWPFGQRAHNWRGVLEFYSEKLGTLDREAIVRWLMVLREREIKGHWYCPCGSGLRIRHCHLQQISELHRKIPWTIASRSWCMVSND